MGYALLGDTNTDADDPSPEDLEDWGSCSTKWAWAHDGSRQNGWFHLQNGGALVTKWGGGTWQLLHGPNTPLLLVTFSTVEHALRLNDPDTDHPTFDMVSKRRLTSSRSLADEVGDDKEHPLLLPTAPPISTTRGWPLPKDAASGGA